MSVLSPTLKLRRLYTLTPHMLCIYHHVKKGANKNKNHI